VSLDTRCDFCGVNPDDITHVLKTRLRDALSLEVDFTLDDIIESIVETKEGMVGLFRG